MNTELTRNEGKAVRHKAAQVYHTGINLQIGSRCGTLSVILLITSNHRQSHSRDQLP